MHVDIDVGSINRDNRGRFFGGVAEWLKATDCKSVLSEYAGSNPAPSTIQMSRIAGHLNAKPARRDSAEEGGRGR